MDIQAIIQHATLNENTLKLNCGDLPRDEYLKVANVIERLGGKWVSKKKYFEFPYSAEQSTRNYRKTGELPEKNPLAFFPTPDKIIQDSLDLGNWREDIRCFNDLRILEPSGGIGAAVDAILEINDAVKELRERWVNFRTCGDNVQVEIYQDVTDTVADSAVCDRANFTFFLEGYTEGQPLAGLPFGNYITNGEWADMAGNATTFTKFFEFTEYLSEDDAFVTSAMYTTDQQNDFAMKLAILEIGKSGMPNGGAVRFLTGFVAGDTDFNQYQL
jgi:hypothetical protein